MGVVIPETEPPNIGLDCSCCDGTLWVAGETPAALFVTISGTIVCGNNPACAGCPSPDGSYLLIQDPDSPCWYTTGDYIGFTIAVNICYTSISVSKPDTCGSTLLQGTSLTPCSTDFSIDYFEECGEGEEGPCFIGTAHIEIVF